MGMFDTLYGRYRCENCDSTIDFEEQTKAFESTLRDFYLGDYVENGSKNYYYRFETICPKCRHENKLAVAIRNSQYVKVVSAREASSTPIETWPNVAYGLDRKRMYEESCRAMLGDEIYSRKVSFLGKKIGDEIKVLGEDWIIDKISLHRDQLRNKMGEDLSSLGIFSVGEYLVNVHNDKCSRVIRITYSMFDHYYSIIVYKGVDEGKTNKNDREYYHPSDCAVVSERNIITDEITGGDEVKQPFEEGSEVWMDDPFFGEIPCVVEHVIERDLGYNYDVSFCGYMARNVFSSNLRERKS